MKLISLTGALTPDHPIEQIVEAVVARVRELEPEVDHQSSSIRHLTVKPCEITCAEFCAHSDFQCCLEDDVNGLLQAMEAADAVIVAAPLYFRVPPAKFHALIERLISIFYFKESRETGNVHSPLYNKPCVLIGTAEYTSPNHMLEYLQEFCHILKMRPVMLPRFPYLGVGGQGRIENDRIFEPLERASEMGTALWETLHPTHPSDAGFKPGLGLVPGGKS